MFNLFAKLREIFKGNYIYLYIVTITLVIAYFSISLRITETWGLGDDFFLAYVPKAEEFLRGTIPLEEYRGPLYPMILGIVYLLVGDYFQAGMLISILSYGLSLIVVTQIFEILLKDKAKSSFATVVYSIIPIVVLTSYSVGTDMLFNLFSLVVILLYFRLLNRQRIDYHIYIAIGAISAVAFLTRYIGILLLFTIIIFEFCRLILSNKRREELAILLKKSISLLFGFLVFVAPYLFVNWLEKGQLLWNKSYLTSVYEILYRDNTRVFEFFHSESLKSEYSSFLDLFINNPFETFTTMLSNVFEHLHSDFILGIGMIVMTFGVVGMIVFIRRRSFTDKELFLFSYILLYFMALLITWHVPRYSLPVVILYVYLSIIGLVFIFSKINNYIFNNSTLNSYWNRRYFLIFVIPILLSSILVSTYNLNKEYFLNAPLYILEMQKAYNENEVPNQDENRKYTIATRVSHAVHYLEFDYYHSLPPKATEEELMSYLKEIGADYVMFSNHDWQPPVDGVHADQLYYDILDGNVEIKDLEFIHRSNASWPNAALFRVK